MLPLELHSPDDIARSLAERIRARRLAVDLTQAGLAARSGVTLASLKRFERTGAVSLESLIRLALALDVAGDFLPLFTPRPVQSLDEWIAQPVARKRGTRT